MSDSTPPVTTEVTNATTETKPAPTPLRCLTGAAIAGGMGTGLYLMTISIAQTFASKPIHSTNITVLNLAAAVRTLVVGLAALGTGIFGFAALGLTGLAIQLVIQQFTKPADSENS